MKRVSEISEKNFAILLKEYNSLLYKLNEKVTLKYNNEIFETVIDSVTAGGQLQVTDTTQKQFNFGEVEFLIAWLFGSSNIKLYFYLVATQRTQHIL